MNNPRIRKSYSKQNAAGLPVVASGLAISAAMLLSGCGGVRSASSELGSMPLTVHVSGQVHGGQQPVVGAIIQLYTVGTTGLKSASTPLIASSVTTDANGAFNITGTYSCAALPATSVYITATGGDPGNLGHANSAIALTAALGPCSSLNANTFIQMDEVTTVAAAYALAPFAADLAHVGGQGANPVGLGNAFTNAGLLADYSTGNAGGAGLAAGVTVSRMAINTVADIIASCVNSTGPGSTNCTALFAATSAADTFGATLAIARAPGASSITGLYRLVNAQSPAQPTYPSQPGDLTIAVTSTGAGSLATPYGIAIDAAGNAWVTNESGTGVSELSAGGAVLASAGATSLIGARGIALDRSGNVWVANTAGNSVVKFTLTAGAVSGTSSFTGGGILAPSAVALDSSGNAWIANFNGNSITELTSTGAVAGASPFTGSGNNILQPQGLAVGPTGAIYVTSGNGSVVRLTNTGGFAATLNDGTLQGTSGVAVDGLGRVTAGGFTTGTSVAGALSEFAADGSTVAGSPVAASGSTTPAGMATDGASIFVANNSVSGGLQQYSFGSSAALSPAPGYGSPGGAVGVAIDASGSVWTTNSGSNSVSKFIGLAAPVATPLAVNAGP